MNERELCYSQPKRELFGLIRVLDKNRYLLLGVRKLLVRTDTKYLKGMLQNPGQGPNVMINH
jgi:hypothetical protein